LHIEREDGMSLRHYLQVLRRHKLLVVVVALLVPAAALYLSLRKEPRFEASAEVLLSRQNLASALTNTPNPNGDVQPDVLTSTQARLARVPEVASGALAAAGVQGRTADDLLESSRVFGEPDADILVFIVSDADPAVATKLATAYAVRFTEYRLVLDTASLQSASDELAARLADLRGTRARRSGLYKRLVATQRELQTLDALQTANARVIRRATDATQVQPRPLRALALSVPLGILLAMALAVIAHILDTRVWSSPEIASRVRLRLLGRTPELPRRLRRSHRLAMLHAPRSAYAGSFRVLRTNLELANRAHGASTIMFTSGGAREGKSLTVANVAVAFARAGRRVVLIDLDIERPAIAKFFAIDGARGLPEVLLGRVDFADALVEAPIDIDGRNGRFGQALGYELGGSLRVLPAGAVTTPIADLIGAPAMARLLEDAQRTADIVLIDTPPLLDRGDAIALSAYVEAVVLVARARRARRGALAEIRRVLASSPAVKLGVVVTAAEIEGEDGDISYESSIAHPLETAAAS
jgi:succinoglycan biosynthesis transport protein ExoP